MADDMERASGPIVTEDLVGHTRAEKAFLETIAARRIPHAWLMSGPRGIGKMTLACRIARFQLARQDGGKLFSLPETMRMASEDPIFRRILAGGHGDFKILEQEVNERTKKRTRATTREKFCFLRKKRKFDSKKSFFIIFLFTDKLIN